MHIVEKVTCSSGIKIWNCWEDEKKEIDKFWVLTDSKHAVT